jgi:hypothetical protein
MRNSAILESVAAAGGIHRAARDVERLVDGDVLGRHVGVVDQERGGREASYPSADDVRSLVLDALRGQRFGSEIVFHRRLLSFSFAVSGKQCG